MITQIIHENIFTNFLLYLCCVSALFDKIVTFVQNTHNLSCKEQFENNYEELFKLNYIHERRRRAL